MKKQFIRSKKMRHGTVAAILTAMVILVAVLLNAVAVAVIERYSLYVPLYGEPVFDVSGACYDLLGEAFEHTSKEEGKAPPVEIWFCDNEWNVSSSEHANYYLYHTANQIADHFPNVTLKYFDIYTNPKPVQKYTVVTNPLTGEEIETALYTTSVIVICGDYYRVYSYTEFFAYKGEEKSPWAYNGEKKLASAIMQAISPKPVACLLNNHGEVFYDYELLTLLDDAGYTVAYIDLYQEEIPENCDLIISYNPNTDLIDDTLSDISEMQILNEFLSEGGNSFLVFLENGTPSLPNFETYLKEWGVSADYAENGYNNRAQRYTIQNPAESLSADGYTIYGHAAGGAGSRFTRAQEQYVIFPNSTSFSAYTGSGDGEAGSGYVYQTDGSYRSMDGKRTMYPLYQSGADSLAWANGAIVGSGSSMLMTLTEQSNEGGASYVGAVASVDFSESEYLQSAVYGNNHVLMHLFEAMGKELTPVGLSVQPFSYNQISTLTTAQMLRWTLGLTVTPLVIVTAVAITVLIKRRRA